MATISTPTRTRDLAEARQRVRSPLERLRSYIRLYVGLEGAAVVGLYLALWFWVGLVLDYGFFRLFGIDWVQVLPWGWRAGLLAVLVLGLVTAAALKVLTRLFREFRDPALALVLERRFPHILGDRLITAVELSDPDKAADLGYSAAMVRETIHEAAGRVEKLPIQEVFDWKRLRRRGVVVGLLVVVGYLLAGSGWCAVNALEGHGVSAAGFGQFNEVAGIWFERNILLQNTIWPRQAHLELIDFPDSGEIRIGRGDKSPTIRARALKYVIAGAPGKNAVAAYREWLSSRGVAGEDLEDLTREFAKKPAEGWRALSWFDLPDLLGPEAPAAALPADWDARDRRAGLTVDEIELNLDRADTHKTLTADAQQALRNMLEQVEARSTDPANSRRLRKLQIPDTAYLVYVGRTTSSQTTMQKLADNEYSGQFGDLKETVHFTVQGLDYYTAPRKIVVVEPPTLESLVREEERPAYLYYRPGRGEQPEELSGKKQTFEAANVSLQGGEVSRIDVPLGTNITLTAHASKDLTSVTVVPHKAQKGGVEIQAAPPEMLDGRTFRTSFKNVRQEQNFLFRFTDTDNVTGQRQVVIVPSEDAPPKIRELAPDDIVRKIQGGYIVTVSARVPFKGKVDDDHGLSDVRYAYTISRLESTSRVNRRAALPVGAIPLLAPAGQGPLPGLVYLAGAMKEATRPADTKAAPAVVEHYSLPSFEQKLRDQPGEFLPLQAVRELLTQRQKEPYRTLLRNFEIKADEWKDQPDIEPLGCDLPLWKHNLKVTDPTRAQPRYQMQIWVEAADTDLDSDKTKDGHPQPHVKSSEEKFTFFIVSENELLAEIAKEEEKLYADLDGMFQKMLETQAKLIRTTQDLSAERIKAEELGAMSVRMDQVVEVLDKSQNTTREVAQAYARILREMKTNRVDQKFIDKVDQTLVTPLAKMDGPFDSARDSVANFRKMLDAADTPLAERVGSSRTAGAQAKEQMRELMLAIERILGAMAGLTDINKLVKILAEIEKQEREQFDTITKIKEKLEDDLFNKVSGGEKKPEDK